MQVFKKIKTIVMYPWNAAYCCKSHVITMFKCTYCHIFKHNVSVELTSVNTAKMEIVEKVLPAQTTFTTSQVLQNEMFASCSTTNVFVCPDKHLGTDCCGFFFSVIMADLLIFIFENRKQVYWFKFIPSPNSSDI